MIMTTQPVNKSVIVHQQHSFEAIAQCNQHFSRFFSTTISYHLKMEGIKDLKGREGGSQPIRAAAM